MKAVILAAGRGSRMRESTSDRPKCLVELNGRSLLSMQMAALAGGGVAEIAAVRGYLGEKLEGKGLHLFDNPRWAETNMVMSLVAAAPWLRQEPCLISYSDIFYPAETVRRLAALDGEIGISFDPDWLTQWSGRFDDPLSDAESFMTDPSGRLTDIGRKVRSLDEVKGQYMGLLKFTPAGWSRVEALLATLTPAEQDKLDMTSLLSRLIAGGAAITTVATAPGWGEVDSEADLAWFTAEVQAGRIALPA